MIFKIASTLFIIAGVYFLLKLSPEQISNDLIELTSKRESLRDITRRIRNGKKKLSIGGKLKYIQDALTSMGKGNQFALVVCGSIMLMVTGAVVAVMINNLFLAPVFAVGFALIPFIYVTNSLASYDKHVKEGLATNLQAISLSYIRTPDIGAAVKESIPSIKPPLREHFNSFLGDITISGPEKAIRNLRTKVDDSVFREWCDVLLQCQNDATIRTTLLPVVDKLSDINEVNREMSSMMASVRMEYYTMVGMVVGNIPLLYVLNKDWVRTLMFETSGKITLGVCGIVILITYLFMLKFTKPIEYNG